MLETRTEGAELVYIRRYDVNLVFFGDRRTSKPNMTAVVSPSLGSVRTQTLTSVRFGSVRSTPVLPVSVTRRGRPALSATALSVFFKFPCEYSHDVFKNVAKIFAVLKQQTSDPDDSEHGELMKSRDRFQRSQAFSIHELVYKNETEKRKCFNLAYDVLKYQTVLEQLLSDTAFFYRYAAFEEYSDLVHVLLFDFVRRKFQPRTPLNGEELDDWLCQIEDAILACRVKLDAMLARRRIQMNAPSLAHMLPENVRHKEGSCKDVVPYVWVNRMKTSVEEVKERLENEGFSRVFSIKELKRRTFYEDSSCWNVLAFSPAERDWLEQHELIEEGRIVLQDRSSCLPPHCVRGLLKEKQSCLVTDVGSGKVAMHICALLWDPDPEYIGTVYAFGVKSQQHRNQLLKLMDLLSARNLKLMDGDFLQCQPTSSQLKSVRAALVAPPCSKTGIINPVDFMVSEGEDISILGDLALGEMDEHRLNELVSRENSTLRHAMRIPDVQGIVYATLSINEAENESVVKRAVEYTNAVMKRTDKNALCWEITPPTVELTVDDILSHENCMSGNFIKHQPSLKISGCFVATVTREKNTPLQTTKDILARAAKTGLLDKIMGSAGSKTGTSGAAEETVEVEGKKKRKVKASKVKSAKSVQLDKKKAWSEARLRPVYSASPIQLKLKVRKSARKLKKN